MNVWNYADARRFGKTHEEALASLPPAN